jgi:hypothetical protein
MTSGWCLPNGHSAAQHAVCQMRQDDPDERIRLQPCGCEEHGGHATPTTTERPPDGS